MIPYNPKKFVPGMCKIAHNLTLNDLTRDSIANNFVIGVYCRCLEILSQIAFSSVANYFRIYRKKQFGIESVGIYSRH